MKGITLGALASLVICITQPLLAQRTNLSFETPSAEDPQRPQDWKFFGAGYEVVLDSIARDGQRSLRLVRPRAGGTAGGSQRIDVAGLRAARVRLSGYVRTRDATGGTAGFAMVVRGTDPTPLYIESMQGTGASGTQDWTRYEIELPLPAEAMSVEFGTAFNGAGTVWFDELDIEVVTDTSVSDEVRAYLERALDLMQTHSMRRDSIDWVAFRADAWGRVRGARSVAAVHPVLETVVRRLGDGHSIFVRPGSRSTSTRPSVAGELVGDRVGYVRVPNFGTADPNASTAFADSIQNAIRALDSAGVCGWIVDLRSNMGGNMWPMIAGVGPLLGESPVGWFIKPTGERTPWTYEAGAGVYEGKALARISGPAHVLRNPNAPVAVLTGSNTASSGEAVVVAFRGRPNTRSFGAPTAGMSTANSSFDLSDGGRLLITTSVYADRTGRKYGAPIPPDELLPVAARGAPTLDDAVAVAARSWVESHPACARPTPQREK